jgi:acyl dehydratase
VSRQRVIAGPDLDDLEVGTVFDTAPAVTLTEGGAALHRAILGSRLALPLDRQLSERVLGPGRWLADPAYVWDVAIGQSTQVTQNVMANLFYRGLAFHRTPVIGDTLRTVTEVVGLKANRDRPDRPASGLVALRITTRDQEQRLVLDFWRCAMLPRRGPCSGARDDLTAVGRPVDAAMLLGTTEDWDLEGLGHALGPTAAHRFLEPDDELEVRAGDVIGSAPELARLTTNVAAVHHDATLSSQGRLVYGGHTIGLALAQATRAVPQLLTVLAWHSCDHLGPVREGDTIHSTILVESVEPVVGGLRRVGLRSRASARAGHSEPPRDVLDWRFVALTA